MDGNKKITGIVFAGIMTLALTACKVQPPGYVSLYIDNSISVNDTAESGITPLNRMDTVINQVVDTIPFIEAESPVFFSTAEELSQINSDSAYQHELKELLRAIADSIQRMHLQIIELKNQHVFLPDTIAMLRNQLTVFKKPADQKVDTVYINKQIRQYNGDSIQTEFKTNRLLQSKDSIIDSLRKRVYELENKGSIKTDTIYVFKETAKLPVAETRQTDHLTLQLIQAKDEQIQMLRNQLDTMQAAATRTPQQTQVIREPVPAQPLVIQQTDPATQQLLLAKDERIQMLQNQLNTMQAAAARTPQQTQVIRGEPVPAQPLVSKQTDPATPQLIQAKNDTILFLQNQLYNLRLQASEKDTVIVVNEVKETQPTAELVAEQGTPDLLHTFQDTIRLLKTRLLSLEEQIQKGEDTPAIVMKDEIDTSYTTVADTMFLVAFYERGEIEPLEEESLLKQVKEWSSDKNITIISLSGYTDSSGSEIVNKEITNRRLNYLSEMIAPWVEKEKVFFQNFGDTFASDSVVSDQRRIEIKIYTK